MATTAVIAGAVIGAAGSYFGAKEANKPQKFEQYEQPYQHGLIEPMSGTWLWNQNSLVNQAMAIDPAKFPVVGSAPRPTGGGGGTPDPNAPPKTQAQIQNKFNYLYDQGKNWNDPSIQTGKDYLTGVIGADSFDGRNAYASNLWNQVSGASFQDPINRYEQFMAEDGRVVDPGGQLVDSMAQGGWFADKANWFFDPSRLNPADDPTLQPYMDAIEAENVRTLARERGSLSAARQGRGRGSGDAAIAEDLLARADNRRQMDLLRAETFLGARKDALGRQMEVLGLVDGRDQAAMKDLTDRYGINTQADVAYRGQNLDAIRGIQDQQQFGLSLQQALGQQLTNEQLTAAGMVPDYATAGLEGLKLALGAAGGQADYDAQLKKIAADRAAARMAASSQRYATDLGHQEWLASFRQQTLNDAFRNMGIVGDLGGHTWGTGKSPGVSSTGAALMGAAGGGMAALGAYGAYSNSTANTTQKVAH